MKHFSAPNAQCVLYPESMDLNVAIEWLEHIGWQVCISPLHDSDVYDSYDVSDWLSRHSDGQGGFDGVPPKVGDPKKPHWHVLFHKPKGNGGSRTLLDALEGLKLTDGPMAGRTAITYLAKVPDLYQAVRYQAHLDSPSKARYDEHEIIYLNGFDCNLVESADKGSRSRAALTRVLDVVDEYNISSFYLLVNGVMGSSDTDMFDVLVSRTPFISMYLSSRNEFFSRSDEDDLAAAVQILPE